MHEIVNERVSVITIYDRQKGTVIPAKIKWQAREYKITKLGYYHKVRDGRTTHHIFHVTDGHLDFRLNFDSETLHWKLEEVSDGNAN